MLHRLDDALFDNLGRILFAMLCVVLVAAAIPSRPHTDLVTAAEGHLATKAIGALVRAAHS